MTGDGNERTFHAGSRILYGTALEVVAVEKRRCIDKLVAYPSVFHTCFVCVCAGLATVS